MDEHDDDLVSEVSEGAEREIDSFPRTRDELEPDEGDVDEEPDLDDDKSEL